MIFIIQITRCFNMLIILAVNHEFRVILVLLPHFNGFVDNVIGRLHVVFDLQPQLKRLKYK